MKLRTLHVLCYLCMLSTMARTREIEWKNQVTSTDPSDSSVSEELKEPLNTNTFRDKRALGLILSGLAQVFGYTVNPVQIATLPNPNGGLDEARATQSSANGNQTSPMPAMPSNSTQSNNSSMTAAPRQRETFRFTGVLNFGNSTGLLNHLQEYERIFHGGNNSSSTQSMSQPPPMMGVSPSQAPPIDGRANQSPQSPLLLKIPLPILSEPPLPSMPQSPLPEIPPQDIMLSYPQPLVPARKEQQTEIRKNENTVKVTVENKQISSGMEVQSPPPLTTYIPYTEDPRWKMEYEERLAELERKQEEQAERLRQQEWYKNRQKDDNYSGEENSKQYGGRGKPIEHDGQDSECKGKEKEHFKANHSGEEEEDQSRERHESDEGIHQHSTSQRPKESEEYNEEEEEGRYRDFKNDEDSKYNNYEDEPQNSENYTSVQYGEPLPLSDDDEQRRPAELRNSYGELLHNRELFDDAFADYFGKFKQPLTDFYTTSGPIALKDESTKKDEDSRYEENEDKSNENVREEDDTPARNKYEEYNLEEDTDTRRRTEKESAEDTSDADMKFSNVFTNGKNRSYYEEKKTTEEMDFDKYMPLVVPVRYLSAPEELSKVKSSFSTDKKIKKDNNMFGADAMRKVSSEESRRPKKENLKPATSFLDRRAPKKLHEEEQKELQAWPPPFDFVVDSTIHTNVVPVRNSQNDNIKVTNIRRRKPEISSRRKEEAKQQRGRRVTLSDSMQKSDDQPANGSYDIFKKDIERDTNSARQLAFNGPVNGKKSKRTRVEAARSKSVETNRRRDINPDFWERYNSKSNYGNTERPNFEMQHSIDQENRGTSYSKKFEPLKRSIEKSGPTKENLHPGEDKSQKNSENRRMQRYRVINEKSVPSSTFVPGARYDYFDFGENTYGSTYGTGNRRLSGVLNGDKKIVKEESIDLTVPQQDVYRYDESLTKFASEPESKSVKVGDGDYANGATTMRIIEQEQNSSSGPISYIDYSGIL